jgi:hypothetical protein
MSYRFRTSVLRCACKWPAVRTRASSTWVHARLIFDAEDWDTFLRNVGSYTDYKVLYSRRRQVNNRPVTNSQPLWNTKCSSPRSKLPTIGPYDPSKSNPSHNIPPSLRVIIIFVRKNSVAFSSPQANYINTATATGRRILVAIFAYRGVSRGQRGGSPRPLILVF